MVRNTTNINEDFLEVRPDYVERLKKIQKGKYSKTFSSVEELKEFIGE